MLAFVEKSPVHHMMMSLHSLAVTKTGFKAWHSLWGLDLVMRAAASLQRKLQASQLR